MDVVKTTSPYDSESDPKPFPEKTDPSSRIRYLFRKNHPPAGF
jgi:hypothetical protein